MKIIRFVQSKYIIKYTIFDNTNHPNFGFYKLTIQSRIYIILGQFYKNYRFLKSEFHIIQSVTITPDK